MDYLAIRSKVDDCVHHNRELGFVDCLPGSRYFWVLLLYHLLINPHRDLAVILVPDSADEETGLERVNRAFGQGHMLIMNRVSFQTRMLNSRTHLYLKYHAVSQMRKSFQEL